GERGTAGTLVPPLLVFLVALAVRLVAIHLGFAEQFFFGKYLVLGRALRESGLIADRPFAYAPIYTYFVAIAQSVFGDALYPVLVVQAVIGSISCVLILRIARRLVGPGWALLPAGIACIHRSFVLYDTTFLSDSLGLALQLGLLAALMRLEPSSRWPVFVLAGVLTGASVLHRPNNLLLLPLFAAVWCWISPWRAIALRQAAVVAGVALAVTLPVVVQNFRLSGTPGITASNPGYIFYSSNNGSSYGFRYSPPELFYRGSAYYERRTDRPFLGDAEIATVISGAVVGRPMTLAESSRYYTVFTLRHMGRYPAHYASLWFQKLWLSVNGYESHDVLPAFVRLDAIRSVTPIGLAWIAPLGLLGLGLSFRRPRGAVWLHLLLVNNLALLLAFYVVVRFRLPLEAVLVILTGPALATLYRWLRQGAWGRSTAAAVALATLGLACNVSFPQAAQRARSRAMEVLLEDGERRMRRGDLAGARRQLERMICEDREELPRMLQAHRLLAEIYARPGASFAGSAMRSPEHFDSGAVTARLAAKRRAGTITFEERRYLGHLYLEGGRADEARRVLGEALASRRPEPLTRYELARALGALDDRAGAVRELERAIGDGLLFTSRGLHAALLLARTCRDRGDPAGARSWIEQASRQSALAPWEPDGEALVPLLAELRALPGYREPLPLDALIPPVGR
ncbi:MAG TPA: glycosyltransferase family 39 protein, partial [Candidatus Polarisedimenticolaceae bacterium]|nr:glycosyltransferase family 39 protein [Candidatus Polarisedimenticolaceae bacterium]